ncbi:MAG: isopentenyl-diphosphate Delta-isomerase [Chloroflexi bacterium]|nr:isopentenyl-diphosphate Delta-isomerase [Chloroflexota bacterium]
MIQRDFVVLVDEYGHDLFNPDGRLSTMEKMEAHRHGLLHRAVSVFVFNDRDELLLQKRAANKYHSPQKWSNTCCTHPSPGEIPIMAVQRRLAEEMGLAVPLTEVFTFSYRVDTGNGLIENEFDHVFFGLSSQNPKPDPDEVSDWKWITMEELGQELIRNLGEHSFWLRQCFGKVIKHKLHGAVN